MIALSIFALLYLGSRFYVRRLFVVVQRLRVLAFVGSCSMVAVFKTFQVSFKRAFTVAFGLVVPCASSLMTFAFGMLTFSLHAPRVCHDSWFLAEVGSFGSAAAFLLADGSAGRQLLGCNVLIQCCVTVSAVPFGTPK